MKRTLTGESKPRVLRFLLMMVILTLLAGCGSYGGYGDQDVKVKAEAPPPPPPVQKIKVTSLDELPIHTYPLQGTLTEMLNDPAAMTVLQAAFRKDLESDLATYQIDDSATLQGKYTSLFSLAMSEKRYDDALSMLDEILALEDKEASRLMTGLTSRSIITAKAAGEGDFSAAFRAELTAAVNALPWDVVQDRVKGAKGRAEFLSENLMLGIVQSQMEPAAAAAGELSADLANGLIGIRYAMDEVLPLNPIIAEVFGEYIEKNDKEKMNIWPGRELVLDETAGLDPVVIGIWDSGVDVDVFGDQMFVNPNEKFDGADTDGNGFVDDVHGIAFDLDGIANPHLLHPLGDQEGKLDSVFEYMQGFIDLTSAIDSPEASSVRKTLSTMEPGDVGDFMTTLSFGGLYMHGTHVAGISMEGNPFARALVARITFDYHTTPKAMTMETARRLADDYVATSKYFRDHDVRVVNMSWGWSFKEIEGSLEANGVGDSAEQRAEMAREMIDVLSDGLKKSMTDSPGILFVSAAGNDDNDVEFDVVIPSNFDLPNLMVVGAVDQAGEPTGFTSGGRNVRAYANGFQVDSEVPGGKTMKMSGTSMSSPNVCNLAAKLIALKPALQPGQVIELIEKGADTNPDHPEMLLIHPANSAGLLEK
ncbi:MAG: S8 family serine peptidase [Gemmatimonadales bacterium]|nr:S8 family serine peptidase [Gemmatimonadales bacterium]